MVVYNSTLDNELVDFLQVANSLLAKCGITFKIRSLDDFTADMFVLVFENVLHCKLQEKIDPPHSREDNIHNLQSLIDSLAIDILNIDLSHITGEAVVSGDRQALCNLLEIFAGVAEYLAIDQNVSQITNVSTDRVDVLHDPDIITGRGMNINYSSTTTPQQSSNNYLASTRTVDTLATLDTVHELMMAPKSEQSLSTGVGRKLKPGRKPREVNSAGGDANTQIASPGPDCYSKVLSPISVNTPSDRLLLPDHSSQQFNLRHVPATWDLNEAGDVDRGAVVSEGGATLGLKTLSGITASGDYLTEEPFSSAGGKSDSSSKCTVINPVMTTDDAESSEGYDRSSSAAVLERGHERNRFTRDLPTWGASDSRRVLVPGNERRSQTVGDVRLQREANHRPNAKYAWLENAGSTENSSTDGAQIEAKYRESSFATSHNVTSRPNNTAIETSSILEQTTTKSTSVQDPTFNFIPKPVTSISFVPTTRDSLTQERDPRVLEADRESIRKAKETLSQSKKESSEVNGGPSVIMNESILAGKIAVADASLQDTAKSFNETFTAGEESAITPRNASNQELSIHDINESKTNKNGQNSDKKLIDRPVSPIETIFEPTSTSFQDASVQCTAKGLRNSGRSSNSSRNKYSKQMPNVFERLYPKKSPLPTPLGKDQSFDAITPRSRTVEGNVSVSGLTLNSASIVADNQNPPPIMLSSTNKFGHKKTGNQYLDGSSLSSDSKHDVFKLNLVDLSASADTSNFSESYSRDKLNGISKSKLTSDRMLQQRYPTLATGLQSRGDTTFKSGLTGSTNESTCERIETDEQYEAVRKRLLEKLQQFRVPESMQGKSAERLQFGAVTEFKGAPAEMSGKWSHVREKLDQETEREKVNTDRLKQNLAKTFRLVKSAEEHKAFMHQIKLDKVHSDMKSLHRLATTSHQRSPIKKRYSSGVIFTQRRGNNYLRGSRKPGSVSARRSKSTNRGIKKPPAKEDSVDGFETERSSSLGAADESNSPRGTSGRAKRAGSQRAPEIGQNEMLSFLLDEFPQLKLSKEMTHVLWKKQLKQMHFLAASAAKENQALSVVGGEGRGRNGQVASDRSSRELIEAEKRQGLLMDIMKKEVEHSIRMKERKEQRQRETIVRTNVREQKQASARVRRYYDEFQVRMKSRMAKKKSKEEQIFRELFDEGLEIQKNRIAEIRKYCREKRQARTHQQQNEVESLENYYRDQFAILAEAVDKEKKEVELNDKAQALALEKMKNELRQKLESDIRLLQMQLVENDDAVYFRGLEAEKMREQLKSALFKTQF